MVESRITHEMKKLTVVVSLAAGYSGSENTTFLNVAQPFAFKFRREFEIALAMWQWFLSWNNIVGDGKLLEGLNPSVPSILISRLALDSPQGHGVGSYMLIRPPSQVWFMKTTVTCCTLCREDNPCLRETGRTEWQEARISQNKLNIWWSHGVCASTLIINNLPRMLICWKNRWLYQRVQHVPTVIRTKFPGSVSNEDKMVPTHLFPQLWNHGLIR